MVHTLVVFKQQILINTLPELDVTTFQQLLYNCELRCVYWHDNELKVFKTHDKSTLHFSKRNTQQGEVFCITCFPQKGKPLEILLSVSGIPQLVSPLIQYLSFSFDFCKKGYIHQSKTYFIIDEKEKECFMTFHM